jgi:poly-gamma-glutamate synthesis protein (capsule biosynthesis protein)
LKNFFLVIILSVFTSFLLFLSLVVLHSKQFFANHYSRAEIIEPKFLKLVKPDPEVTLLLTGDVMLGRSVMQKYLELGDFTYPFIKVADRLKKADLVFVNLENPIVENCRPHIGGFKFCSPPDSVEGLLFAGIDVVTLANNHSENFGQDGLNETVEILSGGGISSTGLGQLVTLKRKGLIFGFLGFNKAEVLQPKLETSEMELIKNSDGKVDVLVVAMHWGVEYRENALPGIKTLAQELIKTGADVVVGHHPHWIQDYEFIDGKPVYYSLGNFVFDQMWSEETKKGLVVELKYKEGKLISTNLHPTYISEIGQPNFSAGYLEQ